VPTQRTPPHGSATARFRRVLAGRELSRFNGPPCTAVRHAGAPALYTSDVTLLAFGGGVGTRHKDVR